MRACAVTEGTTSWNKIPSVFFTPSGLSHIPVTLVHVSHRLLFIFLCMPISTLFQICPHLFTAGNLQITKACLSEKSINISDMPILIMPSHLFAFIYFQKVPLNKRMTTTPHALRSRINTWTTTKAHPGKPQRSQWAGQASTHCCELNLLSGMELSDKKMRRRMPIITLMIVIEVNNLWSNKPLSLGVLFGKDWNASVQFTEFLTG